MRREWLATRGARSSLAGGMIDFDDTGGLPLAAGEALFAAIGCALWLAPPQVRVNEIDSLALCWRLHQVRLAKAFSGIGFHFAPLSNRRNAVRDAIMPSPRFGRDATADTLMICSISGDAAGPGPRRETRFDCRRAAIATYFINSHTTTVPSRALGAIGDIDRPRGCRADGLRYEKQQRFLHLP